MDVMVSMFNELRRYAPPTGPASQVCLHRGASVDDLFTHLNIPSSVQRTTLVNGRRVTADTRLSAGDEVVIMSPVDGG